MNLNKEIINCGPSFLCEEAKPYEVAADYSNAEMTGKIEEKLRSIIERCTICSFSGGACANLHSRAVLRRDSLSLK